MDDSALADRQAVLRVPAGWDEPGATVADEGVTVAGVGPTGIGALDPVVTATADGRTAFYASPSPEAVAGVATALGEGRVGGAGDPVAVVDHEVGRATLPVPDADEAGAGPASGLATGSRRLLAGCGWYRPADPADHATAGGFVDAGPGDVLAAASGDDDAVGLRGRGWGDWCHDEPVAPTLRRAREADGDTAVVVNAHSNANDRLLLESAPFAALEGAELLADTVDADRVVVYASEVDETALDRVETAAAEYPDPAAPIEVVAGPAVYRAAEPTMALEAIEGNHRLEARLRRPDSLPVLDGTPALVHTARTVAHLARRVQAHSRDEDADDGRNVAADGTGDGETRLVTVSGDVETTATVELAETDVLETALGAVSPTGGVKAAAVGGRFGGLADSLAVSPAPDSLADADLGTDGVVEVLGDDRCVVEFVGRRAQRAADTNCGRCVPCREGSTQLTELLREVYDGDYDEDGISELLRVMDASSVCAFGVEAARPARTAMAVFGDEFEAHAAGRCPAGACPEPAEVTR